MFGGARFLGVRLPFIGVFQPKPNAAASNYDAKAMASYANYPVLVGSGGEPKGNSRIHTHAMSLKSWKPEWWTYEGPQLNFIFISRLTKCGPE